MQCLQHDLRLYAVSWYSRRLDSKFMKLCKHDISINYILIKNQALDADLLPGTSQQTRSRGLPARMMRWWGQQDRQSIFAFGLAIDIDTRNLYEIIALSPFSKSCSFDCAAWFVICTSHLNLISWARPGSDNEWVEISWYHCGPGVK